MEVAREIISSNIDEWVEIYLKSNFSFRENQKEAIIDIIHNVLNNDNKDSHNGCHIIEAPTGSGKSLINIISAGVLADFYEKRSYILASDLYLWQQYYDFINNNQNIKRKFGCLKGQTGNYTCVKNGEDLRNCECRMAGLSWAQLYNPDSASTQGFNCARTCKYIKERKKALKSPVTLLTYQLFFYVIDIQNDDERVPVFDHRDVLFCDECHNIPSIVQMQYSPNIKYDDAEHLYNIYNFAKSLKLELFKDEFDDILSDDVNSKYPTVTELKNDWNNIWNDTINFRTSLKDDYKNVMDIHFYWDQFTETIDNIESLITKKIKEHLPLSKEETEIYKECSYVENYLTSFRDFSKTISIVGYNYIVKQINKRDDEIISVDFHCAKEDYMVYQYLLLKTPNKVMLSATIGDKESFEDNIGIKYYGMKINGSDIDYDLINNYNISETPLHDINTAEIVNEEETLYYRIPSSFDFSKSPIYFLNRYKMSFYDREASLSSLKPIIYKMLSTQLKGKRGIIQTGSYAIAKEIINNAPAELKSRFLYYNGSKEKNVNINLHKMSRDTILIGPTLCEGIDLPGDQCSFILILKVPFPQIKDRLVDAKMKLFPLWYNATTSNLIIQGIGRGNRFKDDECITYILDACFFNLYNATQNQYPIELQNRLKIYN